MGVALEAYAASSPLVWRMRSGSFCLYSNAISRKFRHGQGSFSIHLLVYYQTKEEMLAGGENSTQAVESHMGAEIASAEEKGTWLSLCAMYDSHVGHPPEDLEETAAPAPTRAARELRKQFETHFHWCRMQTL